MADSGGGHDRGRLRLLAPGDAGYPGRLAVLADRPTLWAAGALPPPAGAVAVVGTRRPTPDGLAVARTVAAAAAARGLAVVSGLSPGIDVAAHRAALEAGGTTFAVVGWGVDVALDGRDGRLARAMVGHGGGVLAEVPPGSRPTEAARVARDRIQTTLCDVCVVVQAELSSGAMHTARFAREQGRSLVVVRAPSPGPALAAPAWWGNRALADAVADQDGGRSTAAGVTVVGPDDVGSLWGPPGG